jgi:predicted MPP superfamily phosphohydrolase
VAQINALQPDIILIAGDIIDHSLGVVRTQHLEDVLPLLHARYGTYAVLGNHDYHSNPDAVCAFMREVGIIPLRDTAVLVDSGFIVAGRDDYSNKQRKPLSDFVDKTAEYPVIMIDHQPTRPQEAAECNVSLQIAGHTHKGQVFPVTLIINKMYGKYTYGYQRDGNTHFYTSSGIGGWGAPLRLGSHSEIVCVNLKFVP